MNIIIIGGGASAVLCAIEASKNINNHITIIESNSKVLKKLLVTGNGKCNFTNLNFDDKNTITEKDILKYYNNSFYLKTFKQFSNNDLIDYFYNLGLPISIFEKYNQKYVYPLTKNSRTLYYLLLDNLKKNNITIKTDETVTSFSKDKDTFNIATDKDKYNADVVVLSVGGKALYDDSKLDNIYNSLTNNGIKVNKILPALAPLTIENNAFDKYAKFRFEADISLYIDNKKISNEFGEIQINNNLISGIPVLNLSSKAIKGIDENKKIVLSINFLYNFLYNKYITNHINIDFYQYMYDEMIKFFDNQAKNNKSIYLKQVLSYIVETQIIDVIIKRTKLDNKYISKISKDDINKLIDALLDVKLNIVGYSDFKHAQLTQGGVDINEINDTILESNKINNLYFTGEIIDVDGICGGYNLQFAFGTGYIVGKQLNDKN